MGIGVQGEACGEVTEYTADSLGVHAVLEGYGREGVAEIMESDLRDPGFEPGWCCSYLEVGLFVYLSYYLPFFGNIF